MDGSTLAGLSREVLAPESSRCLLAVARLPAWYPHPVPCTPCPHSHPSPHPLSCLQPVLHSMDPYPLVSGPGKQTLKIFDGNDALQRNHFRVITVPRLARSEEVLVREPPQGPRQGLFLGVLLWHPERPRLLSTSGRHPSGAGASGLLRRRGPSRLRAAGTPPTCARCGHRGTGQDPGQWECRGGGQQRPWVPRGRTGGLDHPRCAPHPGSLEDLPCLAQVRPRPKAQGLPAGVGRGGGHVTQAPEIVPCRVGVAYVSIRVTPQSTARTVVLEVLPLLGRQVCMLLWARPAWWESSGSWGSRPDASNSAPHRPRVLRASSWWRCSWEAGKVSGSLR